MPMAILFPQNKGKGWRLTGDKRIQKRLRFREASSFFNVILNLFQNPLFTLSFFLIPDFYSTTISMYFEDFQNSSGLSITMLSTVFTPVQ